MLGWRLLVSAVLIPAVIGLFVWDAWLGPTAPVLFMICLAAGLRCAWELLSLLRRDASAAQFGPVAACFLLLLLSAWGPHWLARDSGSRDYLPTLDQTFAGCVLLLMVMKVFQFREPGGHLRSLGAELLTVSYAGLLLCVTSQLRWLGPSGNGYLALGSLVASTKMGDIGAYSLGRMFGRRKMAPHLSPGKTWMGAVGALVGAVLGAVLWLRAAAPLFGIPWESQWWVLASTYGAAMGLAGLLGDLCESLIKRDMGVKDSAALLPGFGGLLDLLDSILFAGPVAVIMWQHFWRSQAQ